MITLRINITKEVLEATKDCNGTNVLTNCAISYAIREMWEEASTYDRAILIYTKSGKLKSILHGQQKFIIHFDRATPAERAAMQPFSFEIEVPDEVINEINIEEIMDIIKNSKTLELV